MTHLTRIQRMQETKLYKSGEWFTQSKMCQSSHIAVETVATVLAQNPSIFESRRIRGKGNRWASEYRRYRPTIAVHFRSNRFEWENDYTPRYH